MRAPPAGPAAACRPIGPPRRALTVRTNPSVTRRAVASPAGQRASARARPRRRSIPGRRTSRSARPSPAAWPLPPLVCRCRPCLPFAVRRRRGRCWSAARAARVGARSARSAGGRRARLLGRRSASGSARWVRGLGRLGRGRRGAGCGAASRLTYAGSVELLDRLALGGRLHVVGPGQRRIGATEEGAVARAAVLVEVAAAAVAGDVHHRGGDLLGVGDEPGGDDVVPLRSRPWCRSCRRPDGSASARASRCPARPRWTARTSRRAATSSLTARFSSGSAL